MRAFRAAIARGTANSRMGGVTSTKMIPRFQLACVGMSGAALVTGAVLCSELDFNDIDTAEWEEYSQDPATLPVPPLGVVDVVGSALESTVKEGVQDVFLLKFTAGCPTCLAFKTLLEQVAVATQDIESLKIGFYRSDLNFSKSPCFDHEEMVSDPIPKLFPAAAADGIQPPGETMGMKVSQSESIVRWINDRATHKFDVDKVIARLQSTHDATDDKLIERYKEFNLENCAEEAKRGSVRKGPEATYYRSLCDPCNPCSNLELTWFAYMMSYPARSASEATKDEDNRRCLRECMACKAGDEFGEYLEGLRSFSEEQLEQRKARKTHMEKEKEAEVAEAAKTAA